MLDQGRVQLESRLNSADIEVKQLTERIQALAEQKDADIAALSTINNNIVKSQSDFANSENEFKIVVNAVRDELKIKQQSCLPLLKE